MTTAIGKQYTGRQNFQAVEEPTTDAEVKISFAWHPLKEIENANLKPDFLTEALEDLPKYTKHLVIREKS